MKPATYTQLYIHIIFAPKYRDRLLLNDLREKLCKYITGALKNRGHKPIIVNGYIDHIHIFLGLNPKESISNLVAEIKKESTKFINSLGYYNKKFHWQDGYAAFSYSRSQVDKVYRYILNQEIHHRKKSFKEEYIDFLRKFNIEFDKDYLFEFFDLDE